MRTVCLGSDMYVPEKRVIQIFPYNSDMAQKIVADIKTNDVDGSRIYDCSGRRAKVSIVIVEGGVDGVHAIISPLTAKTITKKLIEAE